GVVFFAFLLLNQEEAEFEVATPKPTTHQIRVLSQKTNVCVKINCNLFLCDKWTKHHAGEKPSNPIIKITTI
ncbi:hypothetical protein BMR08_16830, partial [Methylococcaceae bacterium CS2]